MPEKKKNKSAESSEIQNKNYETEIKKTSEKSKEEKKNPDMGIKKTNFSERGKKSRAAGQRFEAKVRQDLEKKGWIVSKWMNTVDCDKDGKIGKLVPSKRKYNPFMKVMTIGTGFPDFVCFKGIEKSEETIEGTPIPEEYMRKDEKKICEVIGLEVKSNGYLDQIEKGMCFWLLENKIFSRILIAKKTKDGKGIEYIDFEVKYKKE